MRIFRYLLGVGTLLVVFATGLYLYNLLENPEQDRFTLLLRFPSAEGLRAGSAVRYRGVSVGEVRRIELTSDGGAVEVQCLFDPSAEATLRVSSRFWIVRPVFAGVAEGASGLDTLIKDSYITYDTPVADPSPQIAAGARFPGLSTPPRRSNGLVSPMTTQPGDLEIEILFAETQGLEAGAPIRYRGIDVGEVREVAFAPNFGGVRVTAWVARAFRGVVRADSEFWITRPIVEAGWISGVDVHDLEALLKGTHVALYSPENSSAPPAADRARFVGALQRPDFSWGRLRFTESAPPAAGADATITPAIVRVHYSCVEKDWFSPDDVHEVESPGVLYRATNGAAMVLVSRAGVDGEWIASDPTGKPDIRREELRVELADGSVQSAGRVWTADGDADLALLRIGADIDTPALSSVDYPSDSSAISAAIEVLTNNGSVVGAPHKRIQTSLSESGGIAGNPAELARGIVFCDGKAIGIASVPRGGTAAVLVLFSLVPESIRSP